MYKKIVSIILLNVIFFSNNAFAEENKALTKDQKQIILENFQNQEIKNIFDNTDFFDVSTNTSLINSSKKVGIFSTLKSKTEEKRIYLEKQNELLIERVNSLENSIMSMDRDIQDKITEVNNTNIKIIQIRNDIAI
jgi:ribosomal protein S15P/S13E